MFETQLFKQYIKKSKIRLATYAILKFGSKQEKNVLYVMYEKLIVSEILAFFAFFQTGLRRLASRCFQIFKKSKIVNGAVQ